MLQFPEHIDRVNLLAEVAELRHRVISHNIANVNTPGYQRLAVSFEEQFQKRLLRESDAKSPASSQSVQPIVVQESGHSGRLDGNSVDVDQEIGELNKNSMMFQLYSQILTSHMSTMRRAIGSR